MMSTLLSQKHPCVYHIWLFLASSGTALDGGVKIETPGGSEVNKQDCACISGPVCANFMKGEGNSGSGEGYSHVHSSIHVFF